MNKVLWVQLKGVSIEEKTVELLKFLNQFKKKNSRLWIKQRSEFSHREYILKNPMDYLTEVNFLDHDDKVKIIVNQEYNQIYIEIKTVISLPDLEDRELFNLIESKKGLELISVHNDIF